MEVAVIGIKYHHETAELIQSSCGQEIHVNLFHLGLGEYPAQHQDIYIFTDRLCEGESLRPDLYVNTMNHLIQTIQKDDIAIINVDDDNLLRHLEGLHCNIITYGFNLKSSVTVSGLDEDIFTGQTSYTCSLQRTLTAFDQTVIEPCEIKLSVSNGFDTRSTLAYSAFLLSVNKI